MIVWRWGKNVRGSTIGNLIDDNVNTSVSRNTDLSTNEKAKRWACYRCARRRQGTMMRTRRVRTYLTMERTKVDTDNSHLISTLSSNLFEFDVRRNLCRKCKVSSCLQACTATKRTDAWSLKMKEKDWAWMRARRDGRVQEIWEIDRIRALNFESV